MATSPLVRIFTHSAIGHVDELVLVRGWAFRLRTLASTTFLVVRDCTCTVQCVVETGQFRNHHVKLDDVVELVGRVRRDARAKSGCEIDIHELRVLSAASNKLPFNSGGQLASVGQEARLAYRPLAARNDEIGNIFRIEAAILRYFREFLTSHHFTEIITSKIVASGTEGGTNLFAISRMCPASPGRSHRH